MTTFNRFVKSVLGVALVAGTFGVVQPAMAASEGGVPATQIKWTFSGIFGTYDENQLQRGFQIFQESCSSCHSADLIAFRTLSEEGGPHFSEEQVKALAAEYIVQDEEAEDGERPAVPADKWPSPFLTAQDARDANNGIVPPDFSVLAKARGISQPFPDWAFNYFTAYQEGGPDYIYSLLTNYHEAPEGVDVSPGQYYNDYLGGTFSMAPPLSDGLVDYEGDVVPETLEQYAEDVAAFMMWMADPHMVERKSAGFRVLIFLFVLAGLMYLVKRKLFANVAH